tara:strand:- start:1445 stop:3835 length:2391 start_codon:yes stop_codon:yes gene_type:complete
MSIPIVEADSEEGVIFSWYGNATSVELKGEWDWDNNTTMTESGGVWSASVPLSEGLYCYKFIVDGQYIFDPNNSYRGFCDGIENSVIRVGEIAPLSHQIIGDKLVVSSIENPNPSHDFIQNAQVWELDLTTLPDGKHNIILNADGKESLAVFWTGPNADFIWDDALIYMVMTDRFVNGNTSNDGPSTGAEPEADWMGGDLEGITQMIDSGYFNDMGVNVLWISPFNTNPNGSYIAADGQHQVSGYHGYWPIEPRQIDPRFGTEQDLEQMIDTAHDAGIRVMADFVINHVHEDHVYAQEHPEWFNQGCICGTSECGWDERRLDCLFMDYMPDLDWKNRNASEQMISDALWWAETFDLDGLRVDAVKHVDEHAISNLATRINERFEATGNDFYLKGETAMGWSGHSLEENAEQYGTINRYIGNNSLDGQADFVLYHAVVDNVFTTGNMDYYHLDYWTNRSQDQYVEGAVMVPYLGSHDSSRYLSRIEGDGTQWNQWEEQNLPNTPSSQSYQNAEQGIAWLLTTPGAPMIYMGDEFGQHGGADPDNRRMIGELLPDNLSSQQIELQSFTQSLANIRLENEVLRRGHYSTFHVEQDLLAFEMSDEDNSLLIILNRGEVAQLESDYNDVIFGDATLFDNALAISANSVTIVAKSLDIEDEIENTTQNETENSTENETGNSTDNSTENETGNSTDNSTLVDSGNNSDENSTSVDNGNNSDDNSTNDEIINATDDDSQNSTVEHNQTVIENNETDSKDNESIETEAESTESNTLIWTRNILAIVALVTLVAFIQMNRKSDDNH